ncbi:hypothetical protein RI543_005073 [Arxiozyma heterogenica]|uniref:Uncharacterized protein n=1 Tax=Arxiozyma heterogenica TaxID=278026 RepID=A0AAN7ZWU0_9SACH|nr:hypothetical protein RI543_005073 [Kazachstania heterogenica]
MESTKPLVHFASDELLLAHSLYLLKQILQISVQEELIAGQLDHLPLKQIMVPPEYFEDRINDGTELDEYKFRKIDPLGITKIDSNGKLLISGMNKDFLFNYFQLPGHGDKYWVLLRDLISLVQDDSIDQETFIQKYKQQLLPIQATSDDIEFMKRNHLLDKNYNDVNNNDVKIITTKSAFITFGAQIISQGTRIVDDYWETLAKQQGFTTHHRVFKCSSKVISLLKELKPQIFNRSVRSSQQIPQDIKIEKEEKEEGTFNFDSPYTIIIEQPSQEIREEYEEQFSKGQHTDTVVPGQAIAGSLELSAQFRVPKYHSKNSFLQATQIKGMDTPIGEHNYNKNETSQLKGAQPSLPNLRTNPNMTSESKISNRMLSSITDSNIDKKIEEEPSSLNMNKQQTSSLNIKGWKFDSLPIGDEQQVKENNHSIKGLSYFEKDNLLKRLNYLTPNQIKETEHSHDCLFVNVGLQKVRKIRSKRWMKYWQYKHGLPIGLLNEGKQVEYIEKRYISKMLQHEDIITNFNELTNTDEIRITKRQANPNLLGYSNIKSFKPPYA